MSRDKHLTLTTMSTSRRMLPFSAVKFGIGRCRVLTADPEQGPKGVERIEAAVEPKGELIEVGLKVLRAYSVVTAPKPAFQIAELHTRNAEQ